MHSRTRRAPQLGQRRTGVRVVYSNASQERADHLLHEIVDLWQQIRIVGHSQQRGLSCPPPWHLALGVTKPEVESNRQLHKPEVESNVTYISPK
jgi:hypothetical protein